MASSKDFRELLDVEVVVDLERLRDLSNGGIPDDFRGIVWSYLLGVRRPDKSSVTKLISGDNLVKEDVRMVKLVKRDIQRLLEFQSDRYFELSEYRIRTSVTTMLSTYYGENASSVSNKIGYISIALPFALLYESSEEGYLCFASFMEKMQDFLSTSSVVQFIMLFRSVLPELVSYFEDEEVQIQEWAVDWYQFMLATVLDRRTLLPLWDMYATLPDGMELHPYVCVAILGTCEEELMSFDKEEIQYFLTNLPALSVPQLVAQALNFREEALDWDV
jgi:hypothetical protein